MRLRIRRRHDYSSPVGWTSLALAAAAALCLIYAMAVDHLGNVSPDPPSWTLAQLILVSAFAVALLTFFLAAITAPPGRGWRPALWAVGVMFLLVVFVFGQGGGG